MARRLSPAELATWQRYFDEQAKSGESHEEYCRRHGLSLQLFRARKYALARSHGRPAASSDAGRSTATPMSFVPVRISAREEGQDAVLEVVVRGGRVVRVGPGFDEATLARLVRALESATC